MLSRLGGGGRGGPPERGGPGGGGGRGARRRGGGGAPRGRRGGKGAALPPRGGSRQQVEDALPPLRVEVHEGLVEEERRGAPLADHLEQSQPQREVQLIDRALAEAGRPLPAAGRFHPDPRRQRPLFQRHLLVTVARRHPEELPGAPLQQRPRREERLLARLLEHPPREGQHLRHLRGTRLTLSQRRDTLLDGLPSFRPVHGALPHPSPAPPCIRATTFSRVRPPSSCWTARRASSCCRATSM